MYMLPSHRLRLYRDFKAIDANDFHGIVRYYEQHEDGIQTLDVEEYLDCSLTYADALFETAQHGRHLVMCDHLLELIIMQNIGAWGGEDLYARTLFRKAASLYRLEEYLKAEYVLRELIKIYPYDRLPRRFLERCLLHRKPAWLLTTRAVCVAFSLIAALVIALELFVVKPFFGAWLAPLQIAHNILLIAGVGVFATGEGLHGWRCQREARSFVRRMQRRKSGS